MSTRGGDLDGCEKEDGEEDQDDDEGREGQRAEARSSEEEDHAQALKKQPPRPSTILACLVRQQGRVRITAHEVAHLHPQAKLDVRMADNGDCYLTYREPDA